MGGAAVNASLVQNTQAKANEPADMHLKRDRRYPSIRMTFRLCDMALMDSTRHLTYVADCELATFAGILAQADTPTISGTRTVRTHELS